MKKKLLIIVSFIALSLFTFSFIAPQYYKSVRGMAMGGTYITVAEDEAVLLYNPALLAEIKMNRLSLLPSLNVAIDQESFKIYNKIADITKMEGGESDTIADQLGELTKEINNKLGSAYLGFFMGSISKNFGFGLFSYTNLNEIGMQNPVTPKIVGNGGQTFAFPVGGAFKLPDIDLKVVKLKKLHMGVSLRYIYNYETQNTGFSLQGLARNAKEISTDSLLAGLGAHQDKGFSMNVGFIGGEDTFRYGLTIRDIYSNMSVQKYEQNSNGEGYGLQGADTEAYPTTVSIGASSQVNKWLLVSSELDNCVSKNYYFDGTSDSSFYKKVHLGSEIHPFNNFLDFKLRVGLNQGYPTYGFGIKPFLFFKKIFLLSLISKMELDYANFTEELSARVGDKPEHIQAINFSVDF